MRLTKQRRNTKGLTLLEVTLVISVLLGLAVVLFQGTSAYKDGSDRAFCIQNMARVQKALRSWSNLNGHEPGDTVPDLKDQIIGDGSFLNYDPECPAGGGYTFSGDVIPESGTIFLRCSIPNHIPPRPGGW